MEGEGKFPKEGQISQDIWLGMGHISEILKNLEILLYYFLFRRHMYTVDLGRL